MIYFPAPLTWFYRSGIFFGLCLTFGFVPFGTVAANRYWVSKSVGYWNDSQNWSQVSGGLPGATVPGPMDEVVFDGQGTGTCLLDSDIKIQSLDVERNFTGSIVQLTSAIRIEGNAFLTGGSFLGGRENIEISGSFVLSGADFTSTSGKLIIRGDITFAEGSFQPNDGLLQYHEAHTLTISSNQVAFNKVEVEGGRSPVSIIPIPTVAKKPKSYLAHKKSTPGSTMRN